MTDEEFRDAVYHLREMRDLGMVPDYEARWNELYAQYRSGIVKKTRENRKRSKKIASELQNQVMRAEEYAKMEQVLRRKMREGDEITVSGIPAKVVGLTDGLISMDIGTRRLTVSRSVLAVADVCRRGKAHVI